MKLTTFTDYSLRVLIYLAVEPGRRATIGEVAAAFAISQHHLTKVVHFLGRAGWLSNVRGNGGGLQLALPPTQVIIGAVVRQTEGDAMLTACSSQAGCHCVIADVCRFSRVLVEAADAFYATLDRYTLADLAGNQAQLAQVLFSGRAG